MMTNWRQAETKRLNLPLPMDWKKVENMMPSAAAGKPRLMMRRAGTPMASICSEALNRSRNSLANSRKRTMPPHRIRPA